MINSQFLLVISFTVSFAAIVVLLLFAAVAYFRKSFQFFPPPDNASWQYHVFWWLFRIMLVGGITLSFVDAAQWTTNNTVHRLFIGAPLVLLGFGAATWLSVALGWRNAHGEAGGLVTSGWFGRSRNPIYLTSIVGMLGWAILAHSVLVSVVMSAWALLYIAAPFVEEPWLEKHYGQDYRDYCERVPRFIFRRKSLRS